MIDIKKHEKTNIIQTCFDFDLRIEDFLCLLDNEWLNDQIINYYLNLLTWKLKRDDVLVFSTFFYYTMMSGNKNIFNFHRVERWNKGIERKKYLLIPINIPQSHWFLVVVNIPGRKMIVHDGMYLEYPTISNVSFFNYLICLF